MFSYSITRHFRSKTQKGSKKISKIKMSRSDKFLLRSSEEKSEEEAEHKSTSYLHFASEPKALKVSPSSKKISPVDKCQCCQGKCEIKHPELLLRRLFLNAFMVLWRRIPGCQSQLWPVGNWFYFHGHHAESWRHLGLLPQPDMILGVKQELLSWCTNTDSLMLNLHGLQCGFGVLGGLWCERSSQEPLLQTQTAAEEPPVTSQGLQAQRLLSSGFSTCFQRLQMRGM